MKRLDIVCVQVPHLAKHSAEITSFVTSMFLCIQLIQIPKGFPQALMALQFDFKDPPTTPPRPKCPDSESTLCTFTILQELKGKSEMDFFSGPLQAMGQTEQQIRQLQAMEKQKLQLHSILILYSLFLMVKVEQEDKEKKNPVTTLVKIYNTPGIINALGSV